MARLASLGVAVAVMIAAAACGPKTGSAGSDAAPAPAPATAAAAPAMADMFFGSWTVTDAKTAPWYDGNGAAAGHGSAFMGKTIVFAPHRASGSSVVACDTPIYTVTTIGPESLFEGGLKDPAKEAAALGFKGSQIMSLNEGCDVSTGDMELDFPMVDDDTILIGLNNMIYTLKRAK